MNKFADRLYKSFSWFVLAAAMIAYLFYYSMKFEGTIEKAITNFHTFIHLIFTVFLNVVATSTADDDATQKGLASEEFKEANDLNDEIIIEVNNDLEDFRSYTKKRNVHERLLVEEDFLFEKGDKIVEELTEKELKEFKKLKPIRHNIYGFNLPLYYEKSKNGEVKYDASFEKSKKRLIFKKILTGLLFGALTINMGFQFDRFWDAATSLVIITSGLFISFAMHYFKPLMLLKQIIPRKVLNKHTFLKGFKMYKKGELQLKEVAIVEEEKEIITEEITVIEDGLVTPILSVIPNI